MPRRVLYRILIVAKATRCLMQVKCRNARELLGRLTRLYLSV